MMKEFEHPSKRIRLDNNDDSENDDMWGGDDVITADEFDMLHTQATQSVMQVTSSAGFNAGFQAVFNDNTNQASTSKVDDAIQQKYEMEGKIKLLNESMERLAKELKDEKSNTDKLLNDKNQELKEREGNLHKEIKKLQSTLEFKNQEMKTVYDKMHILQAQLKETKVPNSPIQEPKNNNFLEKFRFDAATSTSQITDSNSTKESFRRRKLLVDFPRGVSQGSEIVSSILYNRLQSPQVSNDSANADISAASINTLKVGCCSEEVLDNYSNKLQNHLKHLGTLSSIPPSESESKLLSMKVQHRQEEIVACLKDLVHLTSSPQFVEFVKGISVSCNDVANNEQSERQDSKESTGSTTKSASHPKSQPKTVESLLKSLCGLVNSATYPVSFSKNKETELSLAVLLSWASSLPENIIDVCNTTPITPFISCLHIEDCCHSSLKLMHILSVHQKSLPLFVHQNDSCLLCSVSDLVLQKVSTHPCENIQTMLLVESLYSSLFGVHSFGSLGLDSTPCSLKVLQSVITALSKYYELFDEKDHRIVLVLKNGFNLIHLLSHCVPKFKERRSACEDLYIDLMCGYSTLSKECVIFKDIRDYLRDLWDFQEDTNEFETDEDSPQTSNSPDDML